MSLYFDRGCNLDVSIDYGLLTFDTWDLIDVSKFVALTGLSIGKLGMATFSVGYKF